MLEYFIIYTLFQVHQLVIQIQSCETFQSIIKAVVASFQSICYNLLHRLASQAWRLPYIVMAWDKLENHLLIARYNWSKVEKFLHRFSVLICTIYIFTAISMFILVFSGIKYEILVSNFQLLRDLLPISVLKLFDLFTNLYSTVMTCLTFIPFYIFYHANIMLKAIESVSRQTFVGFNNKTTTIIPSELEEFPNS